jgi:hypothetical protein
MKVIRFPGADTDIAAAAIDAALNGETPGAEGIVLRELRADVRALTPPPDEAFERDLQLRVAEWSHASPSHAPRPRLPGLHRLGTLPARLAKLPRGGAAAGGVGAALVALLLVLLTVGPLRSSSTEFGASSASNSAKSPHISLPAAEGIQPPSEQSKRPATKRNEQQAANLPDVLATGGAASANPPASSNATAAPNRLQQIGASVALTTSSAGVQGAADDVARLAVQDGGYVESSHVQTRSAGGSEAGMTLSIPSAKLSATIAALGRIAPVRAVNQESQDITSSYDGARRQLADGEAVRRALLRALAAATTQGRIDSLGEQLAGDRAAISREREALRSVSHRAATSQIEVTITGTAAAVGSRKGLTLARGVHDAGEVLEAVAAVLLIMLAALVPLGLAAFAIAALNRAWRRRRREAALDS